MSILTVLAFAASCGGILAGSACNNRSYKWAGFFAAQTLLAVAAYAVEAAKVQP